MSWQCEVRRAKWELAVCCTGGEGRFGGRRGHRDPQLLQLGQIGQVFFADAVRQLAILGVGVAVSTKRHHVPDDDAHAEHGADGGRQDVPHAGDQPAPVAVHPAPGSQLATEGAARRGTLCARAGAWRLHCTGPHRLLSRCECEGGALGRTCAGSRRGSVLRFRSGPRRGRTGALPTDTGTPTATDGAAGRALTDFPSLRKTGPRKNLAPAVGEVPATPQLQPRQKQRTSVEAWTRTS